MRKKAQSLSLSTIVVAILVILVLVVLAYILSKGVIDFTGTTNSCEDRQGYCASSCPADEITLRNVKGCGTGSVCCVSLATPSDDSGGVNINTYGGPQQ